MLSESCKDSHGRGDHMGVAGSSTKPTIIPDRMADNGQARGRRSNHEITSSGRLTPRTATSMCGSAADQPTAVAAITNRPRKMTSSVPFGVRRN